GRANAPGRGVVNPLLNKLPGTIYRPSATGTAGGFTEVATGNISDSPVSITAGSSITYIVHATVKSSASGTLSNTATVAAANGVKIGRASCRERAETSNLAPQAN